MILQVYIKYRLFGRLVPLIPGFTTSIGINFVIKKLQLSNNVIKLVKNNAT